MTSIISNVDAKSMIIENIPDFENLTQTPLKIIQNIINPCTSESMKLVVCLHIIIMFKDITYLREFLENIYDVHGSIVCEFIINYSISNLEVFVSNDHHVHSNSVNALTCSCLWNTNPQVIRLLIQYGADINTTNEIGFYANEIAEEYPYYNHIKPLMHNRFYSDESIQVYGKRSYNEFVNVYNEILMIAGEIQPSQNWTHPQPT